MTQARIGIGYSDEEWQRVLRRCHQTLHQDLEFFGESFGAKLSGPARIGRISCHHRQNRTFQAHYLYDHGRCRALRIAKKQGETTVPAGRERQRAVTGTAVNGLLASFFALRETEEGTSAEEALALIAASVPFAQISSQLSASCVLERRVLIEEPATILADIQSRHGSLTTD